MPRSQPTLLVGTDGRLRAFWRISLAYAGFFAIEILLGLLFAGAPLARLASGAPPPLVQGIAALTVAGAVLGFVAGLRRFVDRRPLRTVGLVRPGRAVPQFLLGFLIAGAMIAAASAISIGLGWERIHPYRLSAAVIGALGFQLGFIVVSEAVPEELMFRGYILRNLTAVMPLWLAWLCANDLFALGHFLSFSGAMSLLQQVLFVLMALGIGLLAASARIATGALWMSMGLHAANDFLLVTPGNSALPFALTSQAAYGGELAVYAACLTAVAVALLLGYRILGGPSLRERLHEPEL